MKIQVHAAMDVNGKRKTRNYFSCLKALSIMLIFFSTQSHAQIGTWAALTNLEPNENMGVMLLLTDGTVVAHNNIGGTHNPPEGTGWDKLTPSATGSYVNGTWTTIASMNQDRLFFPSQVLPNGKLFVAGGEYGTGDTAGEVYDPVANTWTRTEGVVGKMNISDGNSELLYNGTVLVGIQDGTDISYNCEYYTPSTNKWTTAPNSTQDHDEAAWLKLPDSSILFVGIHSISACRFEPKTDTWIADASTPDSLYDQYGGEAGSANMLPNGKAVFFGATGHNVMYTPTGTTAKGKWVRIADFPFISGSETGMVDAPSAMMVNGHILMTVSPIGTSSNNEFLTPAYFVEYDYVTNTFTQVTSTLPGIGADYISGIWCQQTTMLDLPDGNVLMGINQDGAESQQYFVYTPGSAAIAAGKPTINSILPDGCPNYKITGKLFNGLGEGAGYGDDVQNSTNFPLVRLTNAAGNVYYAKTTNWNRIGAVQTDSLEDTAVFTPPSTLPAGTYSLVVVVNGFASNPTLFTTLQSSTTAQNIACYGGTGSATANVTGGLSPYTYSWSKIGGSGATGTGLTAGNYTVTVTDKNGCTTTAKVTITAPATAVVYAKDSTQATSGCNGGAQITGVSGGTAPYTYSWSPGGQTTASISNQCVGTYTCTITDNSGCAHTTTIHVSSKTTGINNITNSSGISVYPSPSKGSFTIAGVTPGQVIELYNVLGQQLNSVKADNITMYFNIASQVDGIYLIRVLNSDGSLATETKIIKAQ